MDAVGRDNPRHPLLEVIEGRNKGMRYVIDKDKMTIGRGSCDIALDDSKASSKHSTILVNKKGIFISDAQSTNGTFVNGSEIDCWKLCSGDEIKIGNTRFVFVNPNEDRTRTLVAKPGQLREVEADPASRPRQADLSMLIQETIGPAEADDLELSDISPLPPKFGLVSPAKKATPSPIEVEEPVAASAPEVVAPAPPALPAAEKKTEKKSLYVLRITHGEHQGRSHAVTDRHVVLGRGNVGVKIYDIDVSRTHASITAKVEDGEMRFVIKDLGSSNGTFVNGERVEQSELANNDLIQVGLTILRFTLPAG